MAEDDGEPLNQGDFGQHEAGADQGKVEDSRTDHAEGQPAAEAERWPQKKWNDHGRQGHDQ